MLSDQEKEDIQKRQRKVDAGKRYQQELDAQLTELRTRSFNSLASKCIYALNIAISVANAHMYDRTLLCA